MAIATRLKKYLEQHRVDYDVVPHHHTSSSMATARAALIPAGSLAKSVLLEDDRGYLMAVLPANCRLDLGRLHHMLQREIGLATEQEVAAVFQDCELGAVPPVGMAYGLEVIVDDGLSEQSDIYFESGDHRALLHISHTQLPGLLPGARHGRFSVPITA